MEISEDPTIHHEPEGTLFSLGQITLAIVLGSPIAGCLLLARNYQTLGKSESALQSLLIGIILTPAVFFVAYILPDRIPNAAFPVAYTIGMRECIKYFQGDEISRYLESGKKGSWLVATMVGVGFLILIVLLIFGLLFFLNISF